MKISEVTTTTTLYTSDVHQDIQTDSKAFGDIIAWADATPTVWKIVRGTKSAPFGRNATTYYGFERGDTPDGALRRAMRFKNCLYLTDSFWRWRAHFTLKHYDDKGFRGGFFRQFDGTYDRGCCDLDYTPATREEVIDRFLKWCDEGPSKFPTVHVTIDEKVMRKFEANGKVALL